MEEKDKDSIRNLYILKGNDNILCIDCNDKDWIYPLIVICQERYATIVKTIMLKWDNLIREEYDQELIEDINNVYGKENTLLDGIQEYYGKRYDLLYCINQKNIQKRTES